jgi:ribosome-binding factor A
MPTRRQEKVARVVREAVSDAIANHLSDPRIDGLVSVTRVEMAADLKTAEVYLSILSPSDSAKNNTLAAILHARKRIQALVAERITGKFCPVLHLKMDEQYHKTMETMKLLDQISSELAEHDAMMNEQNNEPDITTE